MMAISASASVSDVTDPPAAAGGSVTSDTDADADIAIIVFGESPYAEMQGDVYSVAWYDQRGERARSPLWSYQATE